jgi:hypothetical protein
VSNRIFFILHQLEGYLPFYFLQSNRTLMISTISILTVGIVHGICQTLTSLDVIKVCFFSVAT